MNPITKTIEAGGVQYTFRLPSASEMIQIDIDALELRKGQTEGLAGGIVNSQNVAALQRLCTAPEGIKFADLPFYVVNKLGGGLWQWLNSFSEANDNGVANPQG